MTRAVRLSGAPEYVADFVALSGMKRRAMGVEGAELGDVKG